jgi:hypothetical protein
VDCLSLSQTSSSFNFIIIFISSSKTNPSFHTHPNLLIDSVKASKASIFMISCLLLQYINFEYVRLNSDLVLVPWLRWRKLLLFVDDVGLVLLNWRGGFFKSCCLLWCVGCWIEEDIFL